MPIGGKADQVMNAIVSWLRSGELSVGDKLPTERDLAQKLGVSLQTVNKAMSRLEDAALLSRSTGKGTHVAKLPADDAIAVVCDIKHLSESYHAPSTDKLIEVLLAESKRSKLIPHFLVGRGKNLQSYIDSLGFDSNIWREMRGVISKGWRDGIEEIFDAKNLPLVTLSTKKQGRHSIVFDYVELGRLAAAKLMASSPSRLCMIHNVEPEEVFWNNPIESFQQELAKAAFPTEGLTLIRAGGSPQEAKRACEEASALLKSADGVFVSDDNLASGFAAWLKEADGAMKSSFKAVVQANAEVDLGLPKGFSRLGFSLAETASKSIEMIDALKDGRLELGAEARTWIKPKPLD